LLILTPFTVIPPEGDWLWPFRWNLKLPIDAELILHLPIVLQVLPFRVVLPWLRICMAVVVTAAANDVSHSSVSIDADRVFAGTSFHDLKMK
jgi:hypothetical protein